MDIERQAPRPQLSPPPISAIPTASAIPAPTAMPSPMNVPPDIPTPAPTSTPVPLSPLQLTVTWEDAEMEFRYIGWKTDFTQYSVPYSDIRRGGPPRDGIAPVDQPKFETVAQASSYMEAREPVLSVELGEEARAYPLAILIWHEIVNDELAGTPITVTYCPLCNSAIVFDRRVGDGEPVLDFGTTGYLRHSDMIMWDRQTESWWQQIPGEAIVGEYTGAKLDTLPASLVSWEDFKEAFPDGSVLSRDTGFTRNYGRPPYAGYDSSGDRPFMFVGELDDRLPPMERVLGLNIGDSNVAYPFALFESRPVINDRVGGADIAIFYVPDTLSPFLGIFGSENLAVGSAAAFDPVADGLKLTFRFDEASILDDQTSSSWNIFGEAVSGPLAGARLSPVAHASHFWFAWRVFYPDTEIRRIGDIRD